jgi:N-acetylneuraminate synthase
MRQDGTPYFIAEVSSNHAQDLQRCLAFVDAAAACGADAVKFQLFKIDDMFAPEILTRSPKHRARKAWELPLSFLPHIAERAEIKGVDFVCTPFYLEAVDTLMPYVSAFKIASYELVWDDLLAACGRSRKPVILSTGMADLGEITHAADVLRGVGARDVTLLHTVSAYPTPVREANLAAMRTISRATGLPCGWSDHSVSPAVIMRAAYAFNAPMIEFHLDLDETGAEYAAGHCWLPGQIAPVIATIREGVRADGDGRKVAVPSEEPDRVWRADPSDGLRPFKSERAKWARMPIGHAAE